MAKPLFNLAPGMYPTMQLVPPFRFEGVTMRVFPLLADMERVQRFVDAYVNDIAPPEVGQFRVFLPYVYLQILHYGKMAVESANLGWIAQHEINLTIPLAWYTKEGHQLVFKDWVYLTPHIFVDNPLSMTTGRGVYGWPKSPGHLVPTASGWVDDPTAGRILARVNAPRGTLLEIEEVASLSPFETPSRWLSQGIDMLQGMGLWRERPGGAPANAVRMARDLGRFVVGLHTSTPYWIALTLKQFRDAAQPEIADYQGFVTTKMLIDSIKQVGFFGDRHLLSGDVTGGYRIRLHEHAGVSLGDVLGLEITGPRERGAHGEPVSVLEPVFPFWLHFDMKYPRGDVLAWRTPFSDGWRSDGGLPLSTPATHPEPLPRFNTARGVAFEPAPGPFHRPDATLRVLPMLADRAKLQAFCDASFGAMLKDTPYRVEAWGTYVYMVASSFDEDRDLEMLLPILWHFNGELQGRALVPVFCYANRDAAAIARSEVCGIPTLPAEFASPADGWMDPAGPSPRMPRPLLTVLADVLPTLGYGQKAERRRLIEIVQGSTTPPVSTTSFLLNETFPQHVEQEDHALGPLSMTGSLDILTVKQFRDAQDPIAACYQSVVLLERVFEQVLEVDEIKNRLEIRLHAYPSQPIVETLGLHWKAVDVSGTAEVYVLEPIRPFWARVAMRQHLGRNLAMRAGSKQWVIPPRDET
ncbi:hypothetical protein [Polyangium jinanense]|uniref:Acetoacetate decarboxylase n=1 Tax=Polyangium jinanense TaxID=2829994 RepID=A0A9X4AXY0_9BACT|nr:hypothetical protein [Polyangium jinanense]MDC3962842.1 hypothetical protein [Polyangium jinanense]MDC3988296.1 hypothetical protein [Polyangium jinanense]